MFINFISMKKDPCKRKIQFVPVINTLKMNHNDVIFKAHGNLF